MWGTIAVLVLAVAVAVVVLFGLRVRRIGRRIGSFECALRRAGAKDWTSGIACFGAGRVDWYHLVSLSPRATRSWRRDRLEILGRERRPRPGGEGHVVEARCRYGDEEFELAMVRDSFAGLVSWLESAPPHSAPMY
ncbi:DUF2550 family protein [Georgenia sp. SYP-B2076]|uniref:DUF2550 family protein n=1 Tax=Georgenia sp. SYP-B2076 TaxID=2495881 RepID=UPI000F8DD2FA|nr:DUF2550 family protein [Georgenia sp. SYP-B2076]